MNKKIKEAFAWILLFFLILLIFGSANKTKPEKIEDYSMKDCYTACDEAYDTEIQESVCSTNCYYFEFPSEKANKFINLLKEKK